MGTVKDIPGFQDELEDSDNEGVVRAKIFSSPVSIGLKNWDTLPKEVENDVFSLVYKTALVMGVPVSSTWLSSMSKTSSFLAKTWIALFTIVKTVWIVVVFGYNGLLWSSAGIKMCYFLHCLTGYGLTLSFIFKGKKIADSINQIRHLSMQLHSDTTSKKSKTKILLFVCILIISGFLGSMLHFFFNAAYATFSESIKERIPLPEESEFYSLYERFVLISIVLCYNMSTITLYIALLLLCNAYNTSGDMFAFYGKMFKQGVVKDVFTTLSATEYTDIYRRIVGSIDQMDEALNAFSFYMYMAVMNCVFHVIGVILSKDLLFQASTSTMFTGLIVLSASFLFFQLTYSGENLPSKSNRLKDEMIQMSNYVVIHRPNSASIMMFKILSENIKDNKPYATGYGLFNITKKFIPSVIGVILTYGVLLEQIGAT